MSSTIINLIRIKRMYIRKSKVKVSVNKNDLPMVHVMFNIILKHVTYRHTDKSM